MITLPEDASPLYERVKGYILQNISDGTWPLNYRLPSENDLVATMGVSRMTVHRALRELTAAGFLKRLQGVGTFVKQPEPRSGLLEINNIAAEITARGNRHTSSVISLETVTASSELAVQFEFQGRRKVFHSIVVHFEDGVAVQLEERYVNPQLVPGYDAQDFSRGTTYDYLMKATPVTELEHLISAVAADPQVAELLRVPLGAPCLLLRRRTWSGANVATVNNLTYVGSRYSLGTRYHPSSAT
jgi:GntR family histidine utilization transcriptional repressor